VVFESDDWGSIRMPSINSLNYLIKNGVDLNKGDSLRYNSNDTLATPADLSALFDILSSHRDKKWPKLRYYTHLPGGKS
jgi:hypothetical protein